MQVSNPNNIKIYNLSAGKSLPEWLSDRKKRLMQRKDVDIRRRIQLIQDFDMPAVSTQVQVTKDGQYVLATGIYKPRVRCFDVNQLSMKFERCFDSEVVKMQLLSDDYSKIALLQCDRYVEFHAQYGRYYRIRIPKFGRDMAYHVPSCDLYFVGASSEIYRLNLEQGRFLSPLPSNASSLNVCGINPVHHLFLCGTEEGRVEAWDPRSLSRVGSLDCALDSVTQETDVNGMPSVWSLAFRDGLTMAVGTATGQILLYDIRSDKPLLVKDHMYGLPIKDIEFHQGQDLVVSMDPKIVKFWERNTGKAFTSIQSTSDLNDLCLIPNTGMLFLANEERKIQSYYIPTLGPAPKWCSFLDNLTEELEESSRDTVYDDYRFITKKELQDLGLNHLIGSNLLRAYMHGYFMDIRLYHKAKAIVDPFAYEEYRRKKIREKIEAERENRVHVKKLPKVNKDLAKKIIEDKDTKTKKKKLPSLLEDNRFKALFENPEFQVDPQSDEFRLMHPLVSKLDKTQKKEKKNEILQQFKPVNEASDDEGSTEDSDESSDDDRGWAQEIKRQHKLIRHETYIKQREEDEQARLQPNFYELKSGEVFTGFRGERKSTSHKASIGERLKAVESENAEMEVDSSLGNKTATFHLKKSEKEKRREEENRKHQEERKQHRRPVRNATPRRRGKF